MTSRLGGFWGKIAGAALLLLAVHLAVTGVRRLLRSNPAPPPDLPAMGPIMPANGGPITDLAIQFHRPGAEPILSVYGDLLRSLDPRTTVHVVVSDDDDERIFAEASSRWFAGRSGPRIRYVKADRPITSWIHDRLLVLDPPQPGAPTTLVAPPEPHEGATERVNDYTVPWVLRSHLARRGRVHSAPFQFDGGDLIADEHRVFVTTRLVRRNEDRYASTEELIAAVRETVGREVVLVGSSEHPVPDHHIGMFLTPLGGTKVLVGDPDLALATLRRAGELPPAGPDGTVAVPVGGEPLPLDLSEERLDMFRNVARLLEEEGLSVERVPVLPARRAYAFLSYNNAMLERRDGTMHVYMPSYGIASLDAAAIAAYEAVGATVHPIGVEHIFRMGGSVGCLVAPLRRAS